MARTRDGSGLFYGVRAGVRAVIVLPNRRSLSPVTLNLFQGPLLFPALGVLHDGS